MLDKPRDRDLDWELAMAGNLYTAELSFSRIQLMVSIELRR